MKSRSRARGGSTMLVASLLLVVATLCEASFLGSSDDRGGLFWLFLVTFGLSSIGYLVASLTLTVGSTAMTARSATASVGLVAFGALWLFSQGFYLFGSYLTPADGLLSTSTILSVLMLLGGLLAGIVIGARAIVRGPARWALLIGVVVSGITGAIAGAVTSTALITVLHLVSAVGLAVVGVLYTLDRSTAEAGHDAR